MLIEYIDLAKLIQVYTQILWFRLPFVSYQDIFGFANKSLFIQQELSPDRIQCSAEAAFLRRCCTNFEYDTAKTVPIEHQVHIDFWPVAGSVWEIPMPKVILFFTEIPIVVTAVLIGVLDF